MVLDTSFFKVKAKTLISSVDVAKIDMSSLALYSINNMYSGSWLISIPNIETMDVEQDEFLFFTRNSIRKIYFFGANKSLLKNEINYNKNMKKSIFNVDTIISSESISCELNNSIFTFPVRITDPLTKGFIERIYFLYYEVCENTNIKVTFYDFDSKLGKDYFYKNQKKLSMCFFH